MKFLVFFFSNIIRERIVKKKKEEILFPNSSRLLPNGKRQGKPRGIPSTRGVPPTAPTSADIGFVFTEILVLFTVEKYRRRRRRPEFNLYRGDCRKTTTETADGGVCIYSRYY